MTEFGILCFAGAMGRGSKDEGLTYELATRVAKATEEYGYDTFLLPDDLFITSSPVIECWTALAGLVHQTSHVNLGPYVTCNSYRHPAVLAKIVSTVDVMSEGRVRFFLGACGWGQEIVHRAYGMPYGKLSERVERLKEAIQLIRALWTDSKANFQGKYYSLEDAICEPKPVQKPLRIWTGGSSDALIEVAAEVADGWDTGFCTLDGFMQMSDKLDNACKRFGRDPKEIKRSMHWHTTLIGKDNDEVEQKKRKYLQPILDAKSNHPTRWIREMSDEEYVDRRFLMGTPEECREKVSKYIDFGCDSLNFVFPDANEVEPIRLFAEGVISKLN
jgi:alkanesulfonate monooxygenase SsuD/methylene tetrahydromethanopterin reductase-like flavin-dependent oxidoreductase (luciferase family)